MSLKKDVNLENIEEQMQMCTEALQTNLQTMVKIFDKMSQSPDETSKKKDMSKLISILQELLRLVEKMRTTDSQSQSKDSYGQKSVQVFVNRDTCEQIPEALSKLFKEISYKCEIRRHANDLHSDKPLIVVCPTTTRLETDIDLVLDKIKWSSNYVTLVLHYGSESSEPGLSTAKKLREKEMYQQTQFIDMLFTKESTFNPYQMNVDAKENIKRFLDNYYKSNSQKGQIPCV